jgi:hypothetical protein
MLRFKTQVECKVDLALVVSIVSLIVALLA